jgi:alanine racemase
MARPIRATVRLSALRSNLTVARARVPAARLMAVVKANAYGHGLLRSARALDEADGFAVLEIEAAMRLRDTGVERRVLMLEGFFEPNELQQLSLRRITTVVHSPEQIRMLELARLPQPVAVFLKLNTGMNRLGLPPEQAGACLARLRATGNVGEITAMTHFACADDPKGIDWQLRRFEQAIGGLALPASLANSATLLRYPEVTRDWARIGIMLYGCSPLPDQPAAQLGLQPAMTLSSALIATHDLAAGERVGYGATFAAPTRMRIGVVACGYADGYPRHAPTGTPVLVGGQRTRTLGRVSMDMLCVDLTDLPQAAVGAPVVLWGEGLPAEEVAAAAGTISYELLCALAPRVPLVELP